MRTISYGISLTHWISDIDSNIYKGLCVHIDLIPSMRLCLQWEVVRLFIGADTVYSVFIYGSTCLLYVIILSEQHYVVSDWFIYKLSDPMVYYHWILFYQLSHSMYNWWTECLIIFVWNYVYRNACTVMHTEMYILIIVQANMEPVLLWLDESFCSVYSNDSIIILMFLFVLLPMVEQI